MRTSRLHRVLLSAVAVVAVTATACGSDSKASDDAATASSIAKRIQDELGSTVPGGGLGTGAKPSCPAAKASAGKMRVVNLAVRDGKPVGPVDVYAQGYLPDRSCKPLVKALAYGKVSDYVEVPAEPYSNGTEGGLTFYDAGTTELSTGTTDTRFWRSNSVPDGVEDADDQETMILTSGTDVGRPNPTFSNVIDRSKNQPETDVKVAAGKALIEISPQGADSALQLAGDKSELWASIDGRCLSADPVPGDPDSGSRGPGMLPGNAAPFTVEPGTHEVGIVITEAGTGLSGADCDGLTPVVTGSVDVAAGQAAAVFFGGTSKDALTVISAPIDL